MNYFGEGICFIYPNDKKKSQILFSTNVRAEEIAESLRSKTNDDVNIACPKILQKNIIIIILTQITATVMQMM